MFKKAPTKKWILKMAKLEDECECDCNIISPELLKKVKQDKKRKNKNNRKIN